MNSLLFLRGATVVAVTGISPIDRKFFRIMLRRQNRIRLKELFTLEVDGKAIPGEVNPDGECFWRMVKMVDGAEYGAPYQVGNFSSWLKLYRKPKGGRRKGAGRKKGGGKGRVQQSRSICMSLDDWAFFDRLCNERSRGRFVVKMLKAYELQHQ
jgi:hypothetical protein